MGEMPKDKQLLRTLKQETLNQKLSYYLFTADYYKKKTHQFLPTHKKNLYTILEKLGMRYQESF